MFSLFMKGIGMDVAVAIIPSLAYFRLTDCASFFLSFVHSCSIAILWCALMILVYLY